MRVAESLSRRRFVKIGTNDRVNSRLVVSLGSAHLATHLCRHLRLQVLGMDLKSQGFVSQPVASWRCNNKESIYLKTRASKACSHAKRQPNVSYSLSTK